MRIYAIGDVHGRLDLLQRMHATIEADRQRHPDKDWRIVHLGDYVDRGVNSRGVIDFLVRAGKDSRVVSLAGNHDLGFLEFLATPDHNGIFAGFGGRETALSYGVEVDFRPSEIHRGHRELARAVPRSHSDFLGALHFAATFGDFFFCHAGIRPGIALDLQDPQDLIWIRGEFHRFEGLHPKVVVHGHTPSRTPDVRANRVNLDTGAFQSGVLSALVIDGRDKQILQVSEEMS
ncbi:MAG: metallophosphoesterase [Rhizobiaceae bacterium]|nr:metallophosphoesterase [Rhizobiaceae bacterium]